MAEAEKQTDGGPAFPQTTTSSWGGELSVDVTGGLSLRDWFAGQALAGMGTWAPATTPEEWSNRDVVQELRARWAYEQADAMLASRHTEGR